jgi:hypothetical protein
LAAAARSSCVQQTTAASRLLPLLYKES